MDNARSSPSVSPSDMPKFLIPLLLLGSATVLGQSEIVGPGVRLTPETRVAEFTFGPVQEWLLDVVPQADYFTAYTVAYTDLVETRIDSAGVAQVTTRKAVVRNYVMPAGRPLFFWSEGGAIYAGRTRNAGNRIASGSLLHVGCGYDACFFAVWDGNVGAVITDPEGRPITSKTILPYFHDPLSTASITADPNGFTYVRIDGGHHEPARAVRVDHTGRIVFDVPLRTFEPTLLWAGDHYVEVGIASINSGEFLTSADLTIAGELGQPRFLHPVASIFSQFQIFNDGRNSRMAFINQQRVSVFRVDPAFTALSLEYEWDIPPKFYLSSIATNEHTTIAMLQSSTGALYTMSVKGKSTPSLLSYGPRRQTAVGVVNTGAQYLVSWLERDVEKGVDQLRVARISRGGVLLDRTPVVVAENARINYVQMTALGSDVLLTWTAPSLLVAIVHADGSVEKSPSVDDSTAAPVALVATVNDWVLIRQGGGDIEANRISRSGFVYPPITLHHFDGTEFLAAGSDGDHVVVVTTRDTIVMASDVTIARVNPQPLVSNRYAMSFSGDSYLLVGDGHMFRIDRSGTIASSRAYTNGNPVISSVRDGWLVQGLYWAGTASAVRVLPGNPPDITSTFQLSGLQAISPQGNDHLGLLFVRPTEGPPSIGDALYFRELELFQTPRTRAVTR